MATTLGNCTSFIYTPDVQKLDHFSSQQGIRVKDLSVVTQLGATIKMILDEINEFNLSLFVLAEGNTTGSMGGLTKTDLEGTLTFTGTNSVGSQVTFTGLVQFQPGGDFNMITENDWQTIPLNAEVLSSAGSYGTWTVGGTTAPNASNYAIPRGTVTFEASTA
ncbi:MAG TPA: hypothetical protein VFK30_07550 [Anaerolineae bacterium]|nr:hypothetical protein [Anaerolineae bacterium]